MHSYSLWVGMYNSNWSPEAVFEYIFMVRADCIFFYSQSRLVQIFESKSGGCNPSPPLACVLLGSQSTRGYVATVPWENGRGVE